jgi:hypothetical protein
MKNKYQDRIGSIIRGCLVLECFKKDNIQNPYFKVKCKCGNIFTIASTTLCNKAYSNKDSNCGCIVRVTSNGKKDGRIIPENNIGKTIRQCKILSYIPNLQKPKDKSSGKYECVCTCGNTFIISHSHLFKKQLKNIRANCGCFREEPKEYKREYDSATYHRLYQHKKYTTIRRNLEFSLSEEQFINISKKPCIYCEKVTLRNSYIKVEDTFGSNKGKTGELILSNIKGDRLKNVDKYTVPCSGIDRIDNSKGYIVDNCVPCCTYCNTIKGTRTVEEFYKRVEDLAPTHEQCAKILSVKRKREKK